MTTNQTTSADFAEFSDAVEYQQKFIGKGYTMWIQHIDVAGMKFRVILYR